LKDLVNKKFGIEIRDIRKEEMGMTYYTVIEKNKFSLWPKRESTMFGQSGVESYFKKLVREYERQERRERSKSNDFDFCL